MRYINLHFDCLLTWRPRTWQLPTVAGFACYEEAYKQQSLG